MTVYAKIRIRKAYFKSEPEPVRVYDFELKDIHLGGGVHWPHFDVQYFRTRAEALHYAEVLARYTVVKTWEQAMKLEGVHSFDGMYRDVNDRWGEWS